MSVDVPIRCTCGAFRGILPGASPRSGNRTVCYCDDCQSFAWFLERAQDVLDPHGGTDVFQTSPGRVVITEGARHLACMRLRPGGILRWYAGCCRTPVGNTLPAPRLPFVGLIHACLDLGAAGVAVEDALGPVRARIFSRCARDGVGPEAGPAPVSRDGPPASQKLRVARIVLAARLRGDHRRSPFFRDGEPAAAAYVLRAEELAAAEAARDAT